MAGELKKNHAGAGFAEYTRKILQTLSEEMDRGKIDYIQMLAITTQLSNITTEEDLRAKLSELTTKYPELAEVDFKEKKQSSESIDELVQKYVSHLIKNGDPLKAGEFAQFAEQEGTTLDQIKEKYPDFNEFTN